MEDWLTRRALGDGQRVLALTFMHASRMRLSESLRRSAAVGRFDCVTFDGFARELCMRWRTHLSSLGLQIPNDDAPSVYEAICDAAARLLDNPIIARWVATAYPLVVVDEFQDCYGARPQLVARLSDVADILLAADPFQDLKELGNNPAMMMLAGSGAQTEDLTQVHRTSEAGLLAGASALRGGKAPVAGVGLTIESVPTEHLGASKVCLFIASLKGAAAAVISAGTPTPENFSRKVVDAAAATDGYGRNKSLGPYVVPWESSPDAHRDDLLNVLALTDAHRAASAIRAALPNGNPLSRFVNEWMERERRLRGRSEFSGAEIRLHVARAAAAHRSMPRHGNALRALTIHQAKNREFDRVVVLWGYKVPRDAEMRRRWLYNAITRARSTAKVIVLGEKRLKEPPFA